MRKRKSRNLLLKKCDTGVICAYRAEGIRWRRNRLDNGMYRSGRTLTCRYQPCDTSIVSGRSRMGFIFSQYGTPNLKEEYLLKVTSGEAFLGIAVTE